MNTSGGISSRSTAIPTILSTSQDFFPLMPVTDRERREAGETITGTKVSADEQVEEEPVRRAQVCR